MRRMMAAVALVGTVACGGDSTGPSASYETIAGTYAGELGGVSQGVALVGDFTLTISQSSGSLSGTYGIDGALSDGINAVAVAGSGTLTGTIAAGNNPSVNLTIRPSICSQRTAQFSGTYDSANRRITLQGPVYILENDCSIFLTYPMNVILQR